jgi:hypothetical protein
VWHILAEKVTNIKIVELIKIYKFYFGHLFIRQSDKFVNIVTIVTITLSDEEITKIKVVDLDKFYNFVVDDFFIWNYFVPQNFVWSSNILKFKIWTVQTKSYGKMTKTKVVDLDALYNFFVDIFFHLKTFITPKLCSKFSSFEI